LLLLTSQVLLSSDNKKYITSWNITNWLKIKSKQKSLTLRMTQLDKNRFACIGPNFAVRSTSSFGKIKSEIPDTNRYDSLEFNNNLLILARKTKEIQIYNSTDWSVKQTPVLHTNTINCLESLSDKIDIDDASNDYFAELSNSTDLIDTEYPLMELTSDAMSTSTSTLLDSPNPFMAPVISISNLFSTLDLNNLNINQLMDNLQNKSFSFDLSQPSSQLPASLLSSPKYDIADCVSNCSNQGLCKLNGNRFECQCDLDFSGSKCEIDLRPCSSNPCLNFEKCENVLNGTQLNPGNQQNQNYYSDFVCKCKDKYYGKRCESKINLCQNETCSGNGICKVITNGLNETIKCQCFGINSYEGEKCETKTTKMVVHEATVRTTSYIAVIVVILFYAMIGLMDIHKYFILKQKTIVSTKKKVRKIQNPKPNQNKEIKPSNKNSLETIPENELDRNNNTNPSNEKNSTEMVPENVPDQNNNTNPPENN
jgi:hypothetical protein